MTVKQHLERFAEYHLWAQERALQSMEEMAVPPKEAMTLFGHIIQADWVWHKRLDGESPNVALFDEFASTNDCRAAFEEGIKTWRVYLEGFEQQNLDSVITYRNIKGDEFTNTLQDILTHVMNHGTYHRAQIARIVRQAGGTPALTDFITWAREQQG